MDRKIRILVVAEDPIFLKMIEDSLQESSYPYHIEKVSSGGECLRKLQTKKFGILLLDHHLPDGKGLDWLRKFNDPRDREARR